MREERIHIKSRDFISCKKGEMFLFDEWSPVSEMRLDFSKRDPLIRGEVWIRQVPNGYDCIVRWYKRGLFMRRYMGEEHFFGARGGGALKALIRTTNLYFRREDDVDGGINKTEWDEW